MLMRRDARCAALQKDAAALLRACLPRALRCHDAAAPHYAAADARRHADAMLALMPRDDYADYAIFYFHIYASDFTAMRVCAFDDARESARALFLIMPIDAFMR